MGKILALVLALILGAWAPCWGSENTVGTTTVAKFKDNKPAAFSISFDDSIPSQTDFVIPHLNARGMRGTFLVNPGNDRYKLRERVWTQICPLWDQELADHTMLHEGAKTYDEAVHQIGDVAKIIWKLYPQKSKLLVFARGGGTTWGISDQQIEGLMTRFHLVHRPDTGDGGFTVPEAQQGADDPPVSKEHLLSSVDHALQKKDWVAIYFHGVGPHWEWLGTDGETFDLLLDKLAAAEDKIWMGPCAEVYLYTKERDDAQVKVLASKKGEIRLSASTPHLDKSLYIEPLTLRTEVPSDWEYVTAKQGNKTLNCRKVTENGKSIAQFDAIPNHGVITLASAKSESKIASSLGRPDVQKMRKLVDCKLLEGMKPSGLFDLENGIRAYVFKGNGKAVAALWHDGKGQDLKTITFYDRSSEKLNLKYMERDWNNKVVPIPVKLISPGTLKICHRDGTIEPYGTVKNGAKTEISFDLREYPIYLVGKDAYELEDLLVFGTQPVKEPGFVY